MKACKTLHDYSYFINEVYQNFQNGMEREEAIAKAIDGCIERDILREILLKQKAEVVSMLLFTYDEKRHRRTLLEEGREEGRVEGREDGEELKYTP